MAERLTGLVVATYAPFHADGSVNLRAIEKQVEAFVAAGAGGVFVNGTTGEGPSLSMDERQALARRWCEAARGQLPVVVHAGSNCLPDSRALAAHAQQVGAAGIASVGPGYFKPGTTADLVAFCQAVAAAAPGLPFYYYHIPSRTGVQVAVVDFLQQAAESMPTLAGAKYSHPDLTDYLRCLRLQNGRFDLLFGLDEMLLPALALGARGAVGTTYNFAAALYRRLIAAFERGDLEAARQEQHRSAEMIACLVRHDFLPASKALMTLIGLECGPVRSPLRSLSPEATRRLHDDLAAIGFFDWRQ